MSDPAEAEAEILDFFQDDLAQATHVHQVSTGRFKNIVTLSLSSEDVFVRCFVDRLNMHMSEEETGQLQRAVDYDEGTLNHLLTFVMMQTEAILRGDSPVIPPLPRNHLTTSLAGTVVLDGVAWPEIAQEIQTWPSTTISTAGSPSLDVAVNTLLPRGLNPCVVNIGRAQSAGGDFRAGGRGQEDDLMRRTTLSQSLAGDGLPEGMLLSFQYPLPDYGGVYVPDVYVIRDRSQTGYRIMEQPVSVGVVTVASYPLRNDPPTPQDLEGLQRRIRTVFNAAILHNHDSVVIGGLGCSKLNFLVPHVVRLFHEILSNEYAGYLREVVFAIMQSHEVRDAFTSQFNSITLPLCQDGPIFLRVHSGPDASGSAVSVHSPILPEQSFRTFDLDEFFIDSASSSPAPSPRGASQSIPIPIPNRSDPAAPSLAVAVGGRAQCPYALGCTRTDPIHLAQYDHPQGWVHGGGGVSNGIQDLRPQCQYYHQGCRRKNPGHAQQFSHPPGWTPGSGLRPSVVAVLPSQASLPFCQYYNDGCRRKNPQHAQERQHPPGWTPGSGLRPQVPIQLGQRQPFSGQARQVQLAQPAQPTDLCEWYYVGCRRRNPQHVSDCLHPKGWTPGSGIGAIHPPPGVVDSRPRCQYFDEGCRRRNPEHAREVQHPSGWTPGSGTKPKRGLAQQILGALGVIRGSGSAESGSSSSKPQCRWYFDGCRRTNLGHAKKYRHPPGWKPGSAVRPTQPRRGSVGGGGSRGRRSRIGNGGARTSRSSRHGGGGRGRGGGRGQAGRKGNCRHGPNCFRMSPQHAHEYVHPANWDPTKSRRGQRRERLKKGRVEFLYHQTNSQFAGLILNQQKFKRGARGMGGGGIYFALSARATERKAHQRGVMLKARVKLGRVKTIARNGDSSITFRALLKEGYDSVMIPRDDPEYVVYNWDQVDQITRVSG